MYIFVEQCQAPLFCKTWLFALILFALLFFFSYFDQDCESVCVLTPPAMLLLLCLHMNEHTVVVCCLLRGFCSNIHIAASKCGLTIYKVVIAQAALDIISCMTVKGCFRVPVIEFRVILG